MEPHRTRASPWLLTRRRRSILVASDVRPRSSTMSTYSSSAPSWLGLCCNTSEMSSADACAYGPPHSASVFALHTWGTSQHSQWLPLEAVHEVRNYQAMCKFSNRFSNFPPKSRKCGWQTMHLACLVLHACAGMQQLGTPSAHPHRMLCHAFPGRAEQRDPAHRAPPQTVRSLCSRMRLSMFCCKFYVRECIRKLCSHGSNLRHMACR